jgi:hypothetical protein
MIFRLFRVWIFSALAIGVNPIFAGTIGFTMTFNGNEVTITHTGNEAAYRMSWYTLNAAMVWQPVQTSSGNVDYLAPGQTLRGNRSVEGKAGLRGNDLMLLTFFDQAGSAITQLGWHRAQQLVSAAWRIDRDDSLLRVCSTDQNVDGAATYIFLLPNSGIQSLAMPFAEMPYPPNPQRLLDGRGDCRILNTGEGQAEAWLLFPSVSGALHMQLVKDGLVRGQAHLPVWLMWARKHLNTVAAVIALVGLSFLFYSSFFEVGNRLRLKSREPHD